MHICRSEASNRNVHIPEISDAIAKQILTKCVAVMFAQIGYESIIYFNCIFLDICYNISF